MWRAFLRLTVPCIATGVLCLIATPAAIDSGHAEVSHPAERVRGITISTHTNGGDWALPEMRPTMEEIRDLGAGWVAIHPYAGIQGDGRLRFRRVDPHNPPAYVVNPIRIAHALGLKILIKPHLAYWGSPFAWRGDIRFGDPEQWARFWSDYERWIVGLAGAAREADGFVVGTELDQTLAFEPEWRRIIARVREQTSAPLTYAANWADFERVPFWDALDVIGIQGYFPLAAEEGAGEPEIRRGWAELLQRLRAFALRHDRYIVFTELGYNRSLAAPVRPWDPRTDGDQAIEVQEACMRVALAAIEHEPTVLGAFLWKWFPLPRPLGRDFQLATPRMKRLIAEIWQDPGRAADP